MYMLTKRGQTVKAPYIWMHRSLQTGSVTVLDGGPHAGHLVWLWPVQEDPAEEVCRGGGDRVLKSSTEPLLPSHILWHRPACIQREENISLLGLPRGAPFSHQQEMGTKGLVHMIS